MKKTILSLTSLMLAFILTFIPTTVFAEEPTVTPLTYREYYDDYIIQTPVGQNVIVGVFRYNDLSNFFIISFFSLDESFP